MYDVHIQQWNKWNVATIHTIYTPVQDACQGNLFVQLFVQQVQTAVSFFVFTLDFQNVNFQHPHRTPASSRTWVYMRKLQRQILQISLQHHLDLTLRWPLFGCNWRFPPISGQCKLTANQPHKHTNPKTGWCSESCIVGGSELRSLEMIAQYTLRRTLLAANELKKQS